jgi:hypothetical protein
VRSFIVEGLPQQPKCFFASFEAASVGGLVFTESATAMDYQIGMFTSGSCNAKGIRRSDLDTPYARNAAWQPKLPQAVSLRSIFPRQSQTQHFRKVAITLLYFSSGCCRRAQTVARREVRRRLAGRFSPLTLCWLSGVPCIVRNPTPKPSFERQMTRHLWARP